MVQAVARRSVRRPARSRGGTAGAQDPHVPVPTPGRRAPRLGLSGAFGCKMTWERSVRRGWRRAAVRLVHRLDAHAVVADLPGLHEFRPGCRRPPPGRRRPGAGSGAGGGHRVHLAGSRGYAAPPRRAGSSRPVALGASCFGSGASPPSWRRAIVSPFRSRAGMTRHQALAATVAVDVGTYRNEVREPSSTAACRARPHRLLVGHPGPRCRRWPRPEADGRHLHVRAPSGRYSMACLRGARSAPMGRF